VLKKILFVILPFKSIDKYITHLCPRGFLAQDIMISLVVWLLFLSSEVRLGTK